MCKYRPLIIFQLVCPERSNTAEGISRGRCFWDLPPNYQKYTVKTIQRNTHTTTQCFIMRIHTRHDRNVALKDRKARIIKSDQYTCCMLFDTTRIIAKGAEGREMSEKVVAALLGFSVWVDSTDRTKFIQRTFCHFFGRVEYLTVFTDKPSRKRKIHGVARWRCFGTLARWVTGLIQNEMYIIRNAVSRPEVITLVWERTANTVNVDIHNSFLIRTLNFKRRFIFGTIIIEGMNNSAQNRQPDYSAYSNNGYSGLWYFGPGPTERFRSATYHYHHRFRLPGVYLHTGSSQLNRGSFKLLFGASLTFCTHDPVVSEGKTIYQGVMELARSLFNFVGILIARKEIKYKFCTCYLAEFGRFPNMDEKTIILRPGETARLDCTVTPSIPKGITRWMLRSEDGLFNFLKESHVAATDDDALCHLHIPTIHSINFNTLSKLLGKRNQELHRKHQVYGAARIQCSQPQKLGKHYLLISKSKGIVVRHRGTELFIPSVKPFNQGAYRCSIREGQASSTRIVPFVTYEVLVEGPPAFAVVPRNTIIPIYGSTVLNCSCDSESTRPPATLTWLLNSEPISDHLEMNRAQIKNQSLYLNHSNLADVAAFQCKLNNTHGWRVANAYVKVWNQPPAIIRSLAPENLVAEIQSITLYCESMGAPRADIQWRRNERPLQDWLNMSGRDVKERFHTTDTGNLIIEKVTISDSGLYSCTASNPFGSTNAGGRLVVRKATHILGGPQIFVRTGGVVVKTQQNKTNNMTRIREQSFIQLTCEAKTDPLETVHLQMTWMRNNIPLESEINHSESAFTISMDGRTLTIAKTVPNDSGLYTCVARSRLDSDNASIFLLVQGLSECSAVVPPHDGQMEEVCYVPPQPVQSLPKTLFIYGTRPNNLVIRWKPLPPIEHNGPGLVYRITVACIDCRFGPNKPSKNTTVVSDWSTGELILDHLTTVMARDGYMPDVRIWTIETFRTYEVSLVTENIMGTRVLKPLITTGHSGEGIPQLRLEPPEVQYIGSKEVVLSWTAFPLSGLDQKVHGYFRGFRIEWCEAVLTNELCEYYQVHQDFIVREPPQSMFANLRTSHVESELESLRESGTAVQIINATSSRAWFSPQDVDKLKDKYAEIVLSNNTYTAKLGGLPGRTRLKITVSILNIQYAGTPSHPIYILTKEGVSDAVPEFVVTFVGVNHAELSWVQPTQNDGVLTAYDLEIFQVIDNQTSNTDASQKSSSGPKEKLIKHITIRDPSQLATRISELDMDSCYMVYLWPRTRSGRGHPKSVRFHTARMIKAPLTFPVLQRPNDRSPHTKSCSASLSLGEVTTGFAIMNSRGYVETLVNMVRAVLVDQVTLDLFADLCNNNASYFQISIISGKAHSVNVSVNTHLLRKTMESRSQLAPSVSSQTGDNQGPITLQDTVVGTGTNPPDRWLHDQIQTPFYKVQSGISIRRNTDMFYAQFRKAGQKIWEETQREFRRPWIVLSNLLNDQKYEIRVVLVKTTGQSMVSPSKVIHVLDSSRPQSIWSETGTAFTPFSVYQHSKFLIGTICACILLTSSVVVLIFIVWCCKRAGRQVSLPTSYIESTAGPAPQNDSQVHTLSMLANYNPKSDDATLRCDAYLGRIAGVPDSAYMTMNSFEYRSCT
ncbi:neuronal cell adhesion molecule [Clonorchis sinensis]|uniref:Neuronal cell adhesion molecule n=1 Tax=Clonorchis sinensis TaxID=79923 RepID=G7YAB2_CLOSI|nr:neuronal cell adhesion molecule [Clonorchis sinensis]